jgi:CRISPR type III-A-associated protein Csm2
MPGQQDHRHREQGQRPRPSPEASERQLTCQEALRSNAKIEYYRSGAIRHELLDQEARNTAHKLKGVTRAQIRRFYGQASAIRRRIEVLGTDGVSDGEVLAQVAFLKASAAYACARNEKLAELVKFFTDHCNSIKDAKNDFRVFHRHFEAVVAFHGVFADGKD